MNIDLTSALGTAAVAIPVLSGLYAGYRHVRYGIKAKKDAERDAILFQATQEMKKIRKELEEKIQRLEEELQLQKDNISKDLTHMRELYSAEIKTLSGKIDDLRKDLQDQHSNMVALLTKLVDSR